MEEYMTTLILLMLFPLLWPIMAKVIWSHDITLGKMVLNICIGVIVVAGGWQLGRYAKAVDTEIINGQVVGKTSDEVSCSHSYSCNCRQTCTGSGSNQSCSQVCDTCYEHNHDVDWNLHTTVGRITIDRIDRQGVDEPPRYSRAAVGDPVAKTHRFQNYIKAAPDSLFNTLSEKKSFERFQSKVPEYPAHIYDYHYINRVLTVGSPVSDLAQWNADLSMRLRTLGPAKQANVVLVFTSEQDPDFANALKSAWLGGKKNDVIVVIGTPAYPTIEWVRVLSWTDRELFKVQLRDAIMDLKTVDRNAILDTVENLITSGFQRKHMADFEYLKNQIEPPTWAIVLLFILSVLASVGTSVVFSRMDGSSNFAFNRRRW